MAECLFLLLKILILEDIRRGANQAEAYIVRAGIAWRKGVAAQHDHFVSAAMSAMMDDLVNTGLLDGLAGAERGPVAAAT